MTELLDLQQCRARIAQLEAELAREKAKQHCNECDEPLAYYSCGDCDSSVCKDCFDNGARPADWMSDVERVCETCSKKLCIDCIQLCYDCMNESEKVKIECCQCCSVFTAACKHKDWLTCGAHVDKTQNCCADCQESKQPEKRQKMLEQWRAGKK